ncbi:inverse autotransporter beta domain-containing protein [Neorickettsia risticii]|nr:inverse autotransporter beta-barrel domain-containing protein [Neorickettsia risticii]
MKNFRSVSKARLLLFLSGFCLAVPAPLNASNLKNGDEVVTETIYSKGKGVYYKKVAGTGLLSKVSTTFSALRNSKISDEKHFVDREGSAIKFNRTPHDSQGNSSQSTIQADKLQGGNLSRAEGSTLNLHKANVFGLEKVATQDDPNNKNRRTIGARFTVTNEFSDSNGNAVNMSEFGALLPLLSIEDNLIYIDLKSKLYDAKEGEVSTGVVFRRKMSPLLTGGINLFTDVRFLPEGNYRWYSLGGEIFFKSFSLNGNYYRSDKKGNLSVVKGLDLNFTSPGKSTVILNEKVPGNGYDLGLGLTLNKYIHVHGSAFSFNSPHNKEEKFSGYRAGIDLSFYLNERFSVLVSPEFVSDNEKNRFSVNVGFDLPVGKDYARLLGHVRRDRDVVLFDTDNSYPVNAVFLNVEKEHKIEEIVEVSKGDEIKSREKPTTDGDSSAKGEEAEQLRKLYVIKDDGKTEDITLPKELDYVIVADGAVLKVHIPYLGGEKVVDYLIPRSKKTLKFSTDDKGKISRSIINGVTVDLGDSSKYTLTDVVFNASLIKSDKEHPFQNDENVNILNSELGFSHAKLKSAFYSTKSDTKEGKPVVNYTLRNVRIELPNVVHDPQNPAKSDFKALFASDLDKMGKIDVKLAGEIKVDTKTSIDARKKAEEEAKAASEAQNGKAKPVPPAPAA